MPATWWTVASRCPPPEVLWLYFENSHHSVIFVVEDVAVEHPLPGIVVVADDDARRRVLGDVEHVFPGEIRLTHSVAIQHLKLKSVQMEGMVHPDDVGDLPDFRRPDARADIHPRHVHVLAVDHPRPQPDRAHSRH